MIRGRHAADGAVRSVPAEEAVRLALAGPGAVWLDLLDSLR